MAEDLRLEYRPVATLPEHPGNPKRHEIDGVIASIGRFGYFEPVILDERTGRLLSGHGRKEALLAMRERGLPAPRHVRDGGATGWEVAVVRGWASQDDAEAEAVLVAANQLVIAGGWDNARLSPILQRVLARNDDTIAAIGFTSSAAQSVIDAVLGNDGGGSDNVAGTLAQRFVVPPFTVLDARQGYWQERKRAWIALGIQGELGRGDVVPGGAGESSAWLRKPVDPSANPDAKRGQGGMSKQLAPKAAKSGPRPSRGKNNAPAKPFGEAYDGGDAWRGHGKKPDANAIKSQSSLDALTGASTASGTSVFDPVLCELVYRWFCVPGGHVLDPFAGESTKGIVASYLRFKYTGIELRPEQVAANEAQARRVKVAPEWICGDSEQLDKLLPGGALYDLVWTSPPYYDLEVYSDRGNDGSALPTYDEFMRWYRRIFKQAVARLRPNRFAVVKIGDVRDGRGAYRNFLGDNIACFRDLGLHFYNEAVLVTAVGSLPVRAGRQFSASRKLGRTHQNVLVFYKGDPRHVGKHFPAIEIPEDVFGADGDADADGGSSDTVAIKVSAKSARERFQGCGTDYIKNTCRGRCCSNKDAAEGALIAVLPAEEPAIVAAGAQVRDGFIQPRPGTKGCPFHQANGLCGLHDKGIKPLGCTLSPFTLNDNDTLIIKNRNRRLICYGEEPRVEAYKAFRASLVAMFGEAETDRITAHLDAGGGDMVARMDRQRHAEVWRIVNAHRARTGHTPNE